MRAKTILTVLFLSALAVAVIVIFRALPEMTGTAAQEAARDEILVATAALPSSSMRRDRVTRPAADDRSHTFTAASSERS